ncbi:S8 family serine peptidase [Microbacterium sp.]|uniref:S8 family peptidase n=1 Tax=Microbacterium sp. TaxID=51671 RepID=UPI0028AD2094|nr:S8 family serine peptidase [Microbacterium sp.]
MRSRTAKIAVAAAILGVSVIGVQPAFAAPALEKASTPVPISTPDGQVSSYVVNTKIVNPGQVRKAEAAVVAAGGVVVQSWPQIGVIVAHSTKADFRTAVVAAGGNSIASAGPTRSVAVSEGTPEGVATPWGPGKGQLKKSEAKKTDISDGTAATSTDPREGEQWDMQMINVPQAHEITTGSPDVLIGVLDSGIDPDHPDLASQIDRFNSVGCTDAGRPATGEAAWAPTTSDHGTHVAGTIGAARNGVGIVGVAPGSKMASVKVVNDDGFIYPEYAVCGFMEAGLKGMDVTNNSYYVDPFEFWCGDQPEQAPAMEAVRRAVDWSTSKGAVHVAAAGNSSYDLSSKTVDTSSPNDADKPTAREINSSCKDIPTELDGVVTVSSVDSLGALSSFSNRGLGSIDVAAPGSRVLSTIVRNNGYGLKSGTSMASPHVAGVAALMKSAHPAWGPERIIDELRAQATDTACTVSAVAAPCVGTGDENSYYGEGLVDAYAAVR